MGDEIYDILDKLYRNFKIIKESCPLMSLARKTNDDEGDSDIKSNLVPKDFYPAPDCSNPQFEWVKELKYGRSNPVEIASLLKINPELEGKVHYISYHISEIYTLTKFNQSCLEPKLGPNFKKLSGEYKPNERLDISKCNENCKVFADWIIDSMNVLERYLDNSKNKKFD